MNYCTEVLQNMIGDGDFVDAIAACTVENYQMDYMTLQKIDPTRLRAVRQDINAPGTLANPGATVNQAAVVTKHGEEAARWSIGSWHQAGLPASAYGPTGTIDPAILGALEDALEILDTAGAAAEVPGTNLQSVLFNPANPTRVTAVVGMFPQSTARVMRRRTVGLGI